MDVLFIHIPKAAGTTIEDTFCKNDFDTSLRRGGQFGKKLGFDIKNKCSPQHMHATLLERHLGHRKFNYIFTVVRNPMTRIVSEFKFRKKHFPDSVTEFGDFVHDVGRNITKTPSMFDNHLRCQHEFLWRDVHVFQLENGLESVFPILSEKIQLEITYDGHRRMRSATDISEPVVDSSIKESIKAIYQSDFIRLDMRCHRQ